MDRAELPHAHRSLHEHGHPRGRLALGQQDACACSLARQERDAGIGGPGLSQGLEIPALRVLVSEQTHGRHRKTIGFDEDRLGSAPEFGQARV